MSTQPRTTAKPSYLKLAEKTLSSTGDPLSLPAMAEQITRDYGKCSVKCLEKAVQKGITVGTIVTNDGSDVYTLSSHKRKALRRKKRATNRKPKALTAYNVYVQQEIKKRRTDKQKVTSLMKLIARDWKNLTDTEKENYARAAAEKNASLQ